MAGIAVLGFGVVGSGVVEVIRKGQESINRKAGDNIELRHILDIRNFSGHPENGIITASPDIIFNDPEVNIVVETIGGIGPAYELTKRALLSGRHVVTSNKELVAAHGTELLNTARQNNVHYMFEASVGGGIPIIKPLSECLAANEITSVTGILNGTTNYILTCMAREGKDFDSALSDARREGYAEANPEADIEGMDSCRKIAILSSIAYGHHLDYRNIPTEGISRITYEDLKIADMMNYRVKLIALSRKVDGKVFARVCPAMLESDHPLANVEDVFNAILISGDSIGDVMFYGRGAGKLPTASAVVGDIIDIARNTDRSRIYIWNQDDRQNLVDPDSVDTRYFVRVKVRSGEEARRLINERFGEVEFLEMPEFENQLMFKTNRSSDRLLKDRISQLRGTGSISDIITTLTILEQ